MRRERLSGIDGVRLHPDRPGGTAALVLGGSSGRIDEQRARVLAEAGVLAESIRWFGGPGQNPGPWEIPLETFTDRVTALREQADRVLVLGVSFGAEAALLVGAHDPRVDAVVGFAPSDVVWAGVTEDGRVTSHWTVDGRPLPFLPFDDRWTPDSDPPAYASLYRASFSRHAGERPDAVIGAERIARLVLIAGGDDRVWPATEQADRISARRAERGLATTVITDPEAGHRTILPGEESVRAGAAMQRGGTETADRRLGRAAWAEISSLW